MASISACVYDPPADGLPYVAIVFKPDGEVLVARVVPSRESGEALIASVSAEVAESRGLAIWARKL